MKPVEKFVESWLPLKFDNHLANTVEDIDRNIEYALSRNFTPLQALIGTKSGAVAIVGSGPSLKETWQELKRFKGDIMACNASSQFLLARGIVPTYMMCFDADPLMLEFITPHPDITYLLASRCPQKAFELLEGCKIICWHAGGDEHLDDILSKHRRAEPMVSGGTAAVTRAMVLAEPMGYKEIHLWGADSSFHNGDTHIRQSTTKERMMLVTCGARQFWCSPWMALQAEDFRILVPPMRSRYGIKFVVHGDGLIPHIARIMGIEVYGEWKGKHIWRHAKYNAQMVWANL